MDLRKFIIFFVLVFFLFSINIYSSSSIFGIENITSLPYDAEDYDYIIGYNNSTKNIFVAVYRSGVEVKSFHITENGVCDENGNLLLMFYTSYKPDENRWSSVAAGHYENSAWFIKQGLEPCYSNKDVYYKGKVYIFGKKYHGNLGFWGNLSSSVLFISILKPLLKLMPFIISFIVLFLAFVKAWNFIKGVF